MGKIYKMHDPALKIVTILKKTKNVNGCLIWQGAYAAKRAKDQSWVKSYSTIRYKAKLWYGHRLIWTLVNGKISNDLYVCHKCDIPGCINIDHLFIGTPKDNSQDMVKKGRAYENKVTVCPRGHLYDESNTLHKTKKDGRKFRLCAKCRVINSKIHNDKKQARIVAARNKIND